MHKQRHLLKPMMIVTTTGYIVSAIGPYLADGQNSDAKIFNHIIGTDTEEIKTWLQEDDILIVDRGFRDSAGVLADLGIQMEMPSFLQKGHKQHKTEDANSSRLITKIRWVVESVNARIKTWRYLARSSQILKFHMLGNMYESLVLSATNTGHLLAVEMKRMTCRQLQRCVTSLHRLICCRLR